MSESDTALQRGDTMQVESIMMDGITYHVRVVYGSRQRHFELVEGRNAGISLSDRIIRDLGGTAYSYTMSVEPNPSYPDDYDAFYESISAPVDYHVITLPYGQSTITFEAIIRSGDDTDKGIIGGRRSYSGLTIQYIPMEPQRRPEGGR